jgi:hypothetical protein
VPDLMYKLLAGPGIVYPDSAATRFAACLSTLTAGAFW